MLNSLNAQVDSTCVLRLGSEHWSNMEKKYESTHSLHRRIQSELGPGLCCGSGSMASHHGFASALSPPGCGRAALHDAVAEEEQHGPAAQQIERLHPSLRAAAAGRDAVQGCDDVEQKAAEVNCAP